MIKIVGGIAVTPQLTEYVLDTAPPQRIGDEAVIITAWRERVHVVLTADADGFGWLVAVRRKKAPIVVSQAPRRYPRKGRTQQVQQNRQARLVAKALKLKQQLRLVLDQINRRAP